MLSCQRLTCPQRSLVIVDQSTLASRINLLVGIIFYHSVKMKVPAMNWGLIYVGIAYGRVLPVGWLDWLKFGQKLDELFFFWSRSGSTALRECFG